MKLIGVDIGGTFTDVVFADTDTNDIRIHKVPTTPDDPSLGMLAAVRELCEREAICRRPRSGTCFTAPPSRPTRC